MPALCMHSHWLVAREHRRLAAPLPIPSSTADEAQQQAAKAAASSAERCAGLAGALVQLLEHVRQQLAVALGLAVPLNGLQCVCVWWGFEALRTDFEGCPR